MSDWVDGNTYPENYVGYSPFCPNCCSSSFAPQNVPSCITTPNSAPTSSYQGTFELIFSLYVSAHTEPIYGCRHCFRDFLPGIYFHLKSTVRFLIFFFQSDIKKVTAENLAVFTIRYQYVLSPIAQSTPLTRFKAPPGSALHRTRYLLPCRPAPLKVAFVLYVVSASYSIVS